MRTAVMDQAFRRSGGLLAVVVAGMSLAACSPTVKVQAPKEPITINMNIKIEHEIRVKVDKELDQMIDKNDGLF